MKTSIVPGIVVSVDLKWNDHTDAVQTKASIKDFIFQLKRVGVQPNEFVHFTPNVFASYA